jgi:hypothetical protein
MHQAFHMADGDLISSQQDGLEWRGACQRGCHQPEPEMS